MKAITLEQLKALFSTAQFRSLSMFGALSEPCIEFLLQHGEIGATDSDEQLFSQGEPSEDFYIILSGQLGYYRHNGIERVYLRSYRPGEQLGFASMIGLHERRGDAMVESSGYVLKVPCELFHEVCQRYPDDFVIFLINMTREMSREIIDLDSICANLRTQVNKLSKV